MKVAVVLIFAMVIMMLCQETDGWRRRFRFRLRIFRRGRRLLPYLPIALRLYGKRQVGDPDFDAKYNAACEDGVLTEEEIKSVFGVDENGLAEFIATYDMNGDGVVQCQEYEAGTTIADSVTA